MRIRARWLAGILVPAIVAVASHGEADSDESAAPPAATRSADEHVIASTPEGVEYAGGGIETCTECHDQENILAILRTPHGMRGDSRTPLAHGTACETCHGPSAAHANDEDVPPAIRFGKEQPQRPQNEVCLSCHQGGSRIHWSGSVHESHDVPCAACHQIHAEEDTVLQRDVRPETIVKHDQSELCFSCHQEVRAQIYRLSAHPILQGRTPCSSCHNPHGSTTDHLMVQETLNETCYQCHAEKRGPFLWEHEPARESCTNCHTPHGSVHPSLLVARTPWLCQECHMAQFHPSSVYDALGLPGIGTPNRGLLARNCLNCHSEVHGSNHPSGVRFTR